MVCENCDGVAETGKIVKVTKDLKRCAVCGEPIVIIDMAESIRNASQSKWDNYFRSICIAVASKSPCLSRTIGAILVRDHSIVATGYNGPARGIPHCGHKRMMREPQEFIDKIHSHTKRDLPEKIHTICPRKLMGFESGTGMEWCPAQHAEANCISNAARLGVSVLGATLYMNCVIPCKNCYGMLINAGIVEIVVDDAKPYDKHTQFQIDNSNIKIREFEK